MPPLAAAARLHRRGEDTRGAAGQQTLLNWWRPAGEGLIAWWSLEAAPTRRAARVSLRGRGGGRRGVLVVAVSTCAPPLARGWGSPLLRGGRLELGTREGALPARAAGHTGARPPVMAAAMPSALVWYPGSGPGAVPVAWAGGEPQ